MIRIFVSHSSGSDTTFLEAVCNGLGAPGFQALWDGEEIRTGDEWRQRIHHMLAECHAAVILFSPRALASPWVLKEATVLSWRKTLDPAFQLFPILLPGVTRDDVERGPYGPLDLGALQHATLGRPDQVVSSVRAALRNHKPAQTPLEMLEDEVAALLRRADPHQLEAACERRFGPLRWDPSTDRVRRFSRQLSREIFRHGAHGVREAVGILEAVGYSLNGADARRIIELLAPLWVEPDAAGRIPRVASRSGGDDAVLLNGDYVLPFTAGMYLARAYPFKRSKDVVMVEDAHAGDLVEHVSRCVRQYMRKSMSPLARQPDAAVDAEANRWAGRAPFFVILPFSPPDEQSLEEMRARYPAVTFIIPAEGALPDCATLPPRVCCLTPEVSLAEEYDAMSHFYQALAAFATP